MRLQCTRRLSPLNSIQARRSIDIPAQTAGCKVVLQALEHSTCLARTLRFAFGELQDARDVAGAVQQKIDDLPSGFEERHQEDVKVPPIAPWHL